jgi:tetratricopeptide (TPR) repeat protein
MVYLDLAEFLLDKSLCNLSLKCLDFVTEKDSVRVLFCTTKAKMLKLKYQEAAEDLYNLFTNVDQTLTDAFIMFGHCKFILGEYDDALNAYYKAIRVSNLKGETLKDNLLHQRIGAILINHKKWHDAKVMFEMCASNYQTAFSFMNLGIACLYLEEYENAEKVLTRANILDTSNSATWGYLTLTQLKNGPRINNAF